MAARALILDSQRLFAEAIKGVVECLGFSVAVRTSATGAIAHARKHPLALALVEVRLKDRGLKDRDGLEVGRRIVGLSSGVTVIGTTPTADRPTVEAAARSGFRGLVTKDTPLSDFTAYVRATLEGGVSTLRPSAAIRSRRGRLPKDVALLADQLTRREWQVLALLIEGVSGAEIAERLGISRNTVRTHIQSVLTKLQVHSRLEATGFAVRHGLVQTADWGRSSGVA